MPDARSKEVGITLAASGAEALERLRQREEILQIGYWFQGEAWGRC